jgi:hypothetical protein
VWSDLFRNLWVSTISGTYIVAMFTTLRFAERRIGGLFRTYLIIILRGFSPVNFHIHSMVKPCKSYAHRSSNDDNQSEYHPIHHLFSETEYISWHKLDFKFHWIGSPPLQQLRQSELLLSGIAMYSTGKLSIEVGSFVDFSRLASLGLLLVSLNVTRTSEARRTIFWWNPWEFTESHWEISMDDAWIVMRNLNNLVP